MFDIIFLSYDEPNADFHWERLKDNFPVAQRVHGVKGIYSAHYTAAVKARTPYFYVVDGDSEILDFNFDYSPSAKDNAMHVWYAHNPVNGLEYGYGGIKLLSKAFFTYQDGDRSVDVTTSLGDRVKVIREVASVTHFDTDPMRTWRSAFRECVKLSSKIIRNQKDHETEQWLNTWCTVAEGDHAVYALSGAKQGREYGELHRENLQQLRVINDFGQLREWFSHGVDL